MLAFYQVSARDFLYPEDSLLPKYAESDREVLMHKKIWFSVSDPCLLEMHVIAKLIPLQWVNILF